MAPMISESKQIFDRKPTQGMTTPKEFDVSKINIGNFMINEESKESFLRQWLNYERARKSFVDEKLAEGKANLAFIREEMAALKKEIKKSNNIEDINIFESQYSDLKRDEWRQLCTNVHIAFS